MSTPLYLIIFISLIVIIAWVILYFINRKITRHENEVVPHTVGNKTIYLTRKEIPHFEARSKEDQRQVVNRFHAQVKAGKYLPIIKKGQIQGYIKNEKWNQIKQSRK